MDINKAVTGVLIQLLLLFKHLFSFLFSVPQIFHVLCAGRYVRSRRNESILPLICPLYVVYFLSFSILKLF